MALSFELFPGVGAAPHLPAGILSPYSDGERGALAAALTNHQRLKEDDKIAAKPFLPVPIRGEMPGRAMRGGANVGNLSFCPE
ncbi:hypothetical protein FKO01_40005 [Mesorhizobium sp. B2-3-3]|nr:hypothetical protein FKO01_40005 [Mesorhizobium sp. B2-3-3]